MHGCFISTYLYYIKWKICALNYKLHVRWKAHSLKEGFCELKVTVILFATLICE